MKVLVPIKKTIDYSVHVELSPTGHIQDEGVKKGMNPFCEIALEQAIRWQEKHPDIHVVALSIGPTSHHDILRKALAFGANEAILIETETPHLESLYKAKILAAVAKKLEIDCLLLGKQSIDTDHNHVGQMTSALLDWQQAPFCSEANLLDNGTVAVSRESDAGIIHETIALPAVITSDLRLNEPRFIALPKIIQAKSKPLSSIPATDFVSEYSPKLKHETYHKPAKRTQGLVTDDIELFLKKLQEILS